jgi:hypothetical protein
MKDSANPGRDESDHERLDRNLLELLNELRVILPGVQVLFGFLLAVPFNQRFSQVSTFQRNVYLGVLLCTAMATVMLIAPSALHRIEFREGDKRHIVHMSNRYVIVGLTFLLPAIAGRVLMVTDFLFGVGTTIVATVLITISLLVFWIGLPLRRRTILRRRDERELTRTESPPG